MPSRSSTFHPDREPFAGDDSLQLSRSHIHGPFKFFNPTNARFHHHPIEPSSPAGRHEIKEGSPHTSTATSSDISVPASNVSFLWRSRDNRKGRHTLLIHGTDNKKDAPYRSPPPTRQMKEVGKKVLRMFTYFPYWDISWLVAMFFTLGSVVWVINGFFSWLPTIAPSTEFPNEVASAGGWTAFIGAIIFFETGSILLVLEAVNDSPACFGWAVESLLGDMESQKNAFRLRPDFRQCIHHHQNRQNFVGKPSHNSIVKVATQEKNTNGGKSWTWFPSWQALRSHYFHELGFLAGLMQLIAASVFGVAGFTALPGLQSRLHTQAAINGAYWLPQVVGGFGFIISSALYMLETQKTFYRPAFGVLGWWIGFWNLCGSIGFCLCGALGFASGNAAAANGAGGSTFVGSWAFLIGSVLQLFESIDKHPVEQAQ